MNARMNAARKIVLVVAPLLTKIDGRTRMGKALRAATPANDVSTAVLPDVTAYAAPELPEVREVTPGAMVLVAPPCDARIVVDVVRAGWCTTAKTLSYGLARAGIAPRRIQAVIAAAMRSGLIECVRGVWCVSALAM
jgi:hypothetical protein